MDAVEQLLIIRKNINLSLYFFHSHLGWLLVIDSSLLFNLIYYHDKKAIEFWYFFVKKMKHEAWGNLQIQTCWRDWESINIFRTKFPHETSQLPTVQKNRSIDKKLTAYKDHFINLLGWQKIPWYLEEITRSNCETVILLKSPQSIR